MICYAKIRGSTLHSFFFNISAISNNRLLTILHFQKNSQIVSLISLQKLHSWVSLNLHLSRGDYHSNYMQYCALKKGKLIALCTIERMFAY